MATEKNAIIMVAPGMSEERTVYGVRTHRPLRFNDAWAEEDLQGWVKLEGKRVAVETGYWGLCPVWVIRQ
jgi:hypothetical protein